MTKKQWDKMTDVARWKWVIATQDKEFVVMLDNDYTWIQFPDTDDKDGDSFSFNGYLGWMAIYLLEAIGVKAECV